MRANHRTLARKAAVKYSKLGGPDKLLSGYMRLSPGLSLAEDSTRLLDMAMPFEPDGQWQADFDQPACIWRARDGWLIVHIAMDAEWRNFCATFLNRTIHKQFHAREIWRSDAVHILASTILSTHNVKDAVATCQLYEIPAAVLRHDKQYAAVQTMDHVDWAVISASACEVQQIFNRGV